MKHRNDKYDEYIESKTTGNDLLEIFNSPNGLIAVISAAVICVAVVIIIISSLSFRELEEPFDQPTDVNKTENADKTSDHDSSSDDLPVVGPTSDINSPDDSGSAVPPATNEPPPTSGDSQGSSNHQGSNTPESSNTPDSSNTPESSNTPDSSNIPGTGDAPPTNDIPVVTPPTTSDEHHFVIVPESDPVDQSFFLNDTLFIGDSLTVGLQLYSGLRSNYYSFVGMATNSAFTNAFIEDNGVMITLGEALAKDPQWKRIYIQIGVNEMYRTPESYIASYKSVIDELLSYCPDAEIYVQSVFPITDAVSSTKYAENGGNQKLAMFNRKLIEMCNQYRYYYIDVYSVLADENGALPVDYAGSDGVHLKPISYKVWVQYLCSHTVK